MYLMIENTGVADIRALTTLGLSTGRNHKNKDVLAVFGTGMIQGVNTCLRFNVNPTVFVGRDKLSFFIEPITVEEQNFGQVSYLYKGEKKQLACVVEHGAQDWTNIDMALREFISNAIDASLKSCGNLSGVKIDVVDEINGVLDKTRVFVPLTSEVQSYYKDLHGRFLHFSDSYNSSATVLNKPTLSPCRVYKKGVFVRQLDGLTSLFDYNFGDSLKLDECRNVSDYTWRS